MHFLFCAAALIVSLCPRPATAEGALAFVDVPDVGYATAVEVNPPTPAEAEAAALASMGYPIDARQSGRGPRKAGGRLTSPRS